MAYSELIKNFNRIRDYMREFYVYGFKSRDEYRKKSGRSYDDERRRIESFFGDHMQFRQTADGKNVFLSIDSRTSRHNPLYKAWKAKSFTDGDITLHFILMDILMTTDKPLTIHEITEQIDRYLSGFVRPRTFDESTVRKKLREYASEGLVEMQKDGKTVFYSIGNCVRMDTSIHKLRSDLTKVPKALFDKASESESGLGSRSGSGSKSGSEALSRSEPFYGADILDFFSEVSPCGVIGSFLLDRLPEHDDVLAFKHHYITGALDSEILCNLFLAMGEKRIVLLETVKGHRNRVSKKWVVPLKIMISVQSGRQYLMAFIPESNRIRSFRLDGILSAEPGEKCADYDNLYGILKKMLPHMWGVSTQSRSGQRLEQVDFTVRYNDNEQYIHNRLEREKRCGTVEKIDPNTSRFHAEVYDASELVPWIRTFLCRITEIHFSDRKLEDQFKRDIEEMYRLYGIEQDSGMEGGDSL